MRFDNPPAPTVCNDSVGTSADVMHGADIATGCKASATQPLPGDPMKALVAMEHAMLVTAWTLLTNWEFYRDPGS